MILKWYNTASQAARQLSSHSLCDSVRRQPAPVPWSVPECGLHLPPPSSSLPPPRSALITPVSLCRSTIASLSSRGGGMLDDMNRVNMLHGGFAHTRTLSYCSLLSMTLSLPHTHSHTQRCKHARPPVVALATLRQIQTFPLKAEPKPTTIVCC